MEYSIENFIKTEVDLEDTGTRLDVFVAELIPEIARSRAQQLIDSKESVLVNQRPSKNSYKLKYGDQIIVKIPELKPLELKEEAIELDIRYEDDYMLVVNKPVGMLVHPTSIEKEHTLVNALLYRCKGSLSGINGIMRPGIVHRLDRDTSGLLMIAKNDFAHRHLSEQIKEKTAKRQYLAVVNGELSTDKGFVDAPIDRHPSQRHKMWIVEGGKPSKTHWEVLERFKKFTLVEATLETGRTHQIRVHFASINHPVSGDPLYGGANIKIKLNGQALQAYRLSFRRPSDNQEVVIELEQDDDIRKILKFLRNSL